MTSILARFLECSSVFMKKWKTQLDFNVYKVRVLQISFIYDKKMRFKISPKVGRLNRKSGQTAQFGSICWKIQNVFQKMENTIRF